MRPSPNNVAYLIATVVIIMTVAVVLTISDNEDAALLIALVTPVLATLQNAVKLSKVDDKLESVRSEVYELGNGKMKAAVKTAVSESLAETKPLPVIREEENGNG